MAETGGWTNVVTQEVADALRADPILLLDATDRINSLQSGMAFEELTRPAGLEVQGVWACRAEHAEVSDGIGCLHLREAFAVETLERGLSRDL